MNQRRFPTIRRIGRWCVRVAPRVGFGLLVLFVLVAIPWTYFNIKWGRELEARLAELKAQGIPLTLGDAAPKPVADEENAAVLYQKVFGQLFPGESPEGRRIGGMTNEEERILAEYVKMRDTTLQAQVREILNRPEAKRDLQTIRRASQRPHCVFSVNWEDGAAALFPHLAPFRDAARVLVAQAFLSAEAGRLEEALDWCQVALRMSRHVSSAPTIITELVTIAMQAITFKALEGFVCAAEVEPSLADGLERYLRQIDLREAHAAAMIGERAFGLGSFETTLRPRTWPLWKLEKLTYIDYFAKVIEASKLPYLDALPQLEAAAEDLQKLPFYQGILTKMLAPVFSRLIHKRGQAEANIGLCRMVLALKAYKYEHGAYSESLAQLQQTLDWKLPEDPFSGEDFVYQRQGEGFKLYSIGQDLEDDGGIAPKEPPQNLRHAEADLVWECSR